MRRTYHELKYQNMNELSTSHDDQSLLINGSTKTETLEILQREINSKSMIPLAYVTVLKNKRLEEEEIIEICEYLRNVGISPNHRNVSYGYKNPYGTRKFTDAIGPLHLAIENRMIMVADFFMRCRNPKTKEPNTLTKFFVETERERFLAQYGRNSGSEFLNYEKIEIDSITFLEWLISKEPDFDRENDHGYSSLSLAVEFNLQHILPVLLTHANSSSVAGYKGTALLREFIHKNGSERRWTRINIKSKNWYSGYSSRYSAGIVKTLLNRGAFVNESLIHLAIEVEEDIDMIKMLVDKCDVSYCAKSLLNEFMKYSCEELSDLKTECYLQILRDLVAKGAKLDGEDELEMRPLQLAVMAKNLIASIGLAELGSDFTVLTKDSENLLHLFSCKNSNNDVQEEAMVNFLIGKGCQINAKDKNGASPLHWAAMRGIVTLITQLINHGADVNCRDKNMKSPLHYALRNFEATEVVELLLKNGANVNAKDGNGKRALSLMTSSREHIYERERNKTRMIKLLLKWGAQINALDEIINYHEAKHFIMNMHDPIVEEMLKYGQEISVRYKIDIQDNDYYKLLIKHRAKLSGAKMLSATGISAKMLSTINHVKKRIQPSIPAEIKKLKTTFIDSQTSLYHLLHMDVNRRCIHINNDKLKNLIDSPTLDEKFPLYSYLIVASYREAVVRKALLEPAKNAWLELTEISLPDICIEHILSYLSNLNLIDIIDSDYMEPICF